MPNPNPNIFDLGCAEEYSAIITAADLKTYAAQVNFSDLHWSRVLDDISEADVTVPDVFGGLRCNIELGTTIVPWRYGLRIERNGAEVWSGPITAIERPTRDGIAADAVTISANDSMVWGRKRVTPDFLSFSDADAGTVFRAVLDAGMAAWNPAGLDCPDFLTSYTMTREVIPLDFEYTFDILTELANSAVDYFVINNELCVYDVIDRGWYVLRDGVKTRLAPTADPYGRYIYGLFTDDSFIERPGYRIDGMSQGNKIYIPGADSGEAGFRRFWESSGLVDPLDGLLVHVDVSSLYRPQADQTIIDDAVFQQRADTLYALYHDAVITISGGSLATDAPVDINSLFPGSLWAMDLAEHGLSNLLTVQRLKRIDVNVSVGDGVTETVRPSLIPLGTDETVIG